MAQVMIEENGLQFTARCPNCSNHFLITEEREKDGKQILQPNTSLAPNKCKRCGCPMDPAEGKKFTNKMAGTDSAPGLPAGVQVVTVAEPKDNNDGTDNSGSDDDEDD